MRIAFFGLPLAALLLHADGHELVLVASCRPDAPGNRRAARLFGRRFLRRPRADDDALLRRVRDARPDLLVSWFWTTRLPISLVEACPLGGFGVHPSLLPRHRGPDPYFWAIDEGDAETGVTAHRLADEYDTGAILRTRTLAIDPAWTAWQLAKALDRPSLALLREVAADFARGAPPPDVAQDDARATQAPAPDERRSSLDARAPTDAVLRRVRALAPTPGALLTLGEAHLSVTRVARAERFPAALEPGEAAVVDHQALLRTGDGAVVLLEAFDDEDPDAPPLGPTQLATLVTSQATRSQTTLPIPRGGIPPGDLA